MIRRVAAWFAGIWVAATAAAESLAAHRPGAPYVPTPDVVVQEMLDLAGVGSGDYVTDLGSGDGRIVIQATQRGAHGQGVERKRRLLHEAGINAARAGVGERVVFVEQDLFAADLSQTSVVAMYLVPDQTAELRPRLLEQLRPGARVVSHGFPMGDWQPDRQIEVAIEPGCGPGSTRSVRLWIVPADVAGRWQWVFDGRPYTWRVNQRYQKLETTLESGGIVAAPENVELNGRDLAFETELDGVRYAFRGRVEGARIEGTIRSGGGQPQVEDWSAQKLSSRGIAT